MSQDQTSALRYEQLDPAWAAELEGIELASFPNVDPADLYDEAGIRWLGENFPEGGFVVFDGARAVGMGFGVFLDFDFDHPDHPLDEVYNAHDPDGDWYYGTTIAVLPEYRGRGIGGRLYELRKGVVQRFNKRGIVAGGVLPGYADHKHAMTADEYLQKVTAGELYDPTLTFQIENGFEARAALNNYLNDPSVDNHACLIVWPNPDHRDESG